MILKDDSFDMRDERSPAYLKKKSIPTSSTTVRSMILFRILCSLITFFIRYPDPKDIRVTDASSRPYLTSAYI